MRILARAISFITNPIFVLFPVPYLLIYRFGFGHEYATKWTLFSLVFIFIAGLFVLYEVKHKVFSDMDVSKREQRPLLFAVIAGITFVYFFSLYFFRAPLILFFIIWGVMLGTLLATLINTRVKVSLHVGTITAVILTLIRLFDLSYLLLLIIPIVAWARIRIRRHTHNEVVAGCLLGITLTLVMYILLKYIYGYSV